MAVYEYQCPQCKSVFELMRPMNEADRAGMCPECGSEGRKLVSNFGSKTGSYIQVAAEPFRLPGGQTGPKVRTTRSR